MEGDEKQERVVLNCNSTKYIYIYIISYEDLSSYIAEGLITETKIRVNPDWYKVFDVIDGVCYGKNTGKSYVNMYSIKNHLVDPTKHYDVVIFNDHCLDGMNKYTGNMNPQFGGIEANLHCDYYIRCGYEYGSNGIIVDEDDYFKYKQEEKEGKIASYQDKFESSRVGFVKYIDLPADSPVMKRKMKRLESRWSAEYPDCVERAEAERADCEKYVNAVVRNASGVNHYIMGKQMKAKAPVFELYEITAKGSDKISVATSNIIADLAKADNLPDTWATDLYRFTKKEMDLEFVSRRFNELR